MKHEAANIGLIVLAAGASRRLGRPKQLLQFQGCSLLRRAAQTALASACRPVLIVLGANAVELQQEVVDLPLRVVENECWPEGMSSSIRAGVAALDESTSEARIETSAAVLMVCDQTLIDAANIIQLIAAHQTTHKPIVATTYSHGVRGVPALFARQLFPQLMKLTGAAGARRVIEENLSDVACVDLPQASLDVDTLADYECLLAQHQSRSPDTDSRVWR